MNNDINLLHKGKKNVDAHKRILKIVRIIAVSSLVAVAITTTVLFVIRSQSQLQFLQNEESSLLSRLDTMDDKVSWHLLVKDRAFNILLILKERQALDKIITFVMQSIPQDVIIDSFTLDKGNVNIGFSSTSLSSVGTCLDNFITLVKTQSRFRKVNLSGFSYDGARGKYMATISITLL